MGTGFVYLASGAFALAMSGAAHAGNGAPSGSHFNLNLIGASKPKLADLTDSQRHTIFVPLSGNCKIGLAEGDFTVLDGNCTDGDSAFQLPNPDADNDGSTTYSVFARALGKPGGSSVTTTCATDPSDGSTVCSTTSMTLLRSKGKSSFTNVSKDLLYIYNDVDGDGTLDRVSLFDSKLEDYYWNYDNNGLRNAQLRFYECATIVPDATDPNGAQLDTDCFSK
ncbi:MAG TPA: hypothetical protein VN634_02790 [Candidatus Limnocylindrales bacterium]|nr:hypothetical protein [Candidatus Limnocylindrales bacterium]